jgi:hypothetical protein
MKIALFIFSAILLTNASSAQTPDDSLVAKMIRHLTDSSAKNIFDYPPPPAPPPFNNTDSFPLHPLRPNAVGKALMTPIASKPQRTLFYAYIGGTAPQVYTHRSDGLAGIVAGTGNAVKAVHVLAGLDMNDLSGLGNFSFSFRVSRALDKNTSLTGGGLHLFANRARSDFGASYFLVISHAVQSVPAISPGYARLFYSLGAGTGRFLKKSRLDEKAGRGSYGTALFGNLSFEVIRHVNLIAEWDGLNLDFDIAWRPSRQWPSLLIGLADLTRYSGDKVRLIGAIGYSIPLVFFRKTGVQ